jgi:hypothetical protein
VDYLTVMMLVALIVMIVWLTNGLADRWML